MKKVILGIAAFAALAGSAMAMEEGYTAKGALSGADFNKLKNFTGVIVANLESDNLNMEVTSEGNLKMPLSQEQKIEMQKFKSPFKAKFSKVGNDIVLHSFVDADGKDILDSTGEIK